ncbi:helix-turn-helix transcriptional regulator [Yoonia sp.]|uniref:S24 family peptidase n=1 Tax=Yoonia sp. TaxID=2212373 RepID=UPI00358F65BF
MYSDEKPFEEIVTQRLEALGKKPFAVETEAGLPADAIRNVIRSDKKNGPTLLKAKAICDALGLEFYIGPPRDLGDTPHTMIDGEDFATIPYHDVAASAGPGAVADQHADIQSYAFRRDWLQRQGVAPQNAEMLRVRGDSMAPRIVDGDTLLIDTAHKEPPIRPLSRPGQRRSSIYVVDVDGETRVKWVERPDFQNLILYSEDAANHPPEAFLGRDQERLRFIGKVIWWGHTVG